MLRISRPKAYRREMETFNAQRSLESPGAHELKSGGQSVMDARESLAKRNRRDGHLCDHICADQWATAEDFTVEPASCCFARSGVDGLDWRDDSREGLSRSQLRHAGPIARDDADHGLS